MFKKFVKPEESQPQESDKEGEAARKPDKSSTEGLVTSLRSDMLLTSSAAPSEKNILQRINLKLLVGILLTLFFIVLIWFFITGEGRPILEQSLANLVGGRATPTVYLEPSPVMATNTPAQPTNTPLPSPTLRPTSTPIIKPTSSPTLSPALATSTAAAACRDVLSITLADVGQTMCVRGTVINLSDQPNNFMVIFSNKRGAFYWVSYDLAWKQAELDTCYQITGKIQQIGNSPMLVFNYHNMPEVCP